LLVSDIIRITFNKLETNKPTMKLRKLLTASALAIALTLAMSTTALAQSTEQSTETTVKCETSGNYGQDTNCTTNTKTNQKVVYRADGTPVVVHDVVNSGVNGQVIAGAFALSILGLISAAYVLKA
jgi:hypothetical protein